jgi:hypothetical protein
VRPKSRHTTGVRKYNRSRDVWQEPESATRVRMYDHRDLRLELGCTTEVMTYDRSRYVRPEM